VRYRLVAAVIIALGLLVATAVPAGAAPPKTAQVSGNLLLYALIPDSAFGSSFTSHGSYSTGRKLLSTHARYNVATMSCSGFEGETRVGSYGDTAGAWDAFYDPNDDWPAVVNGVQAVNQFATNAEAMSFYLAARAKYEACTAFTEPNPTDHTPGGGTINVSATAVSKTLVGRNLAFQVIQESAWSEDSGDQVFMNMLYVVSGDDVYHFWDDSGTNDEPWPALMAKLIQNVQQLR
jgi:hypothetical protein